MGPGPKPTLFVGPTLFHDNSKVQLSWLICLPNSVRLTISLPVCLPACPSVSYPKELRSVLCFLYNLEVTTGMQGDLQSFPVSCQVNVSKC